jgi:hypothetical protein
MIRLKPLIFASAFVLLASASFHAQAGTILSAPSDKNVVAPETPADESIFDKLWSIPKLYKDDTNPFIEELDFTGRYQGDYFDVQSRKGDSSFYETRRFRLGLEAAFAERHIIIKADLDTNLRQYNTKSVFYNRMTNLYIKFHINDAFNIVVGKQEPKFGYDRMVSDTLQDFFERSFFDDQFMPGPDYTSGVTVNGKVGHLGYQASVYSDAVDKEFGQFNGGQSELAEISYDFSKAFNCNRALWAVDYLHIGGINTNTNIFQSFHNGLATYLDLKKDRWGLVTQFAYGNGVQSKGDIYQIMLMPTFDITKKLQAEVRYQLGLADQSNGITTLNRQEKTVGKFTGDNYNAVYLGMNYYIYGEKLRLMAGAQYENISGGTGASAGNSGWTFLTGVRVYW